MSEQIRNALHGAVAHNDRLWMIHTKDFSAAIAEYNQELTGFDPRLAELDPEAFVYGGNAYYILGHLCERRGWTREPVTETTS